MLDKKNAIENAEESEEDSIENYLAKLQDSIQNIMAEDTPGNVSLQKSQVVDTIDFREIGETSNRPEKVLREQIVRQEKPDGQIIKEEDDDDFESEPEEENKMQAAEVRLARLERWYSVTCGNRRMKLRQRLLKKAIRDQEREIEQLEIEEKIAGRLRKKYRTFASKPADNVGRIIKR